MFPPVIEQFIAEVHGAGPGIAEYAVHFRCVLDRIDIEADYDPRACKLLRRLERFLSRETPLPRRICTAAAITLNLN